MLLLVGVGGGGGGVKCIYSVNDLTQRTPEKSPDHIKHADLLSVSKAGHELAFFLSICFLLFLFYEKLLVM